MVKTNSTPLILNGREVRDEVLKNIKIEINKLKLENKRLPGLAVILVGENPASNTYVKNKEAACKEIGLYSEIHKLPTSVSEKELIDLIELLNNKNTIDGIIVQLPLSSHINPQKVINSISPDKDIDGLHPYNLGRLLVNDECLTPCTPLAVIEILKHYPINLNGMSAVVIGRSTLVGKPLAMLLVKENATVTIAHSRTKNIEEVTKSADILVCAVGKPRLVKKHWVKRGAIVIDVGINKIFENGTPKLVGDVDFESVSQICQAITPVPGGVGLVTVAMLMSNTLKAYRNRENRD